MRKNIKRDLVAKKSGQKGDRRERAHRLEGVVRNKGIKPKKK